MKIISESEMSHIHEKDLEQRVTVQMVDLLMKKLEYNQTDALRFVQAVMKILKKEPAYPQWSLEERMKKLHDLVKSKVEQVLQVVKEGRLQEEAHVHQNVKMAFGVAFEKATSPLRGVSDRNFSTDDFVETMRRRRPKKDDEK